MDFTNTQTCTNKLKLIHYTFWTEREREREINKIT